MTRIATWNVNGIRARLPQLIDWLASAKPDVVALQETKVRNEDFPIEALAGAGYRCLVHGQPRYNGMATLWRASAAPQRLLTTSLPAFDDDACRLLVSVSDEIQVINVYVPNGQSLESEAYGYKLRWLDALKTLLAEALQSATNEGVALVLLGDFNIAPNDIDVHDPSVWSDTVLVSVPERAALSALIAEGVHDLYREQHPDEQAFSWWDYRMQAFRRDRGLRIDLILGCAEALARTSDCWIDRSPRALEKPSDHTPVVLDLN